MYCQVCHYALDGLPEARCPECGREFNPSDSSTFARGSDFPVSRSRSGSKRRLRIQLWLGICAFGYAIYTLSPAPQGFYDYLARCIAMPMAVFLFLDPFRERKRLNFLEDFICSLLFVLALILTVIFIYGALSVRSFSNR